MPNRVVDIEAYLANAGLRPYRNTNQFWSHIDSRYPKPVVGDLERAYLKLERGDEAAFYHEIFQSLKISIDFASLRHDLYRTYLNWFLMVASTETEVDLIVDVGCGNGILSCFYGQLFPNAKVVGFDVSEPGIDCAKELAQQLGLKNTEFVVGDLNDLNLPIEKASVDLITSVASLTPAPASRDGDVAAYDLLTKKPRLPDLIQVTNLAPYLKPESGLLISFDKVSNLAMQATWANIIQRCGLGIDLTRSSWLTYGNIESDTISLPGIVAGPHIEPASADDIMAFYITKETDLSEWTLDFGKESLSEAVFTFINPKRYLRGARATYTDGSGIYWYEVWQAGPFAILFEHTDQGFRTLRVAPATKRDELIRSVDEWIDQTSSYAEVVELDKPEVSFGTGS
jgi:SAM-dependent methyltransferase